MTYSLNFVRDCSFHSLDIPLYICNQCSIMMAQRDCWEKLAAFITPPDYDKGGVQARYSSSTTISFNIVLFLTLRTLIGIHFVLRSHKVTSSMHATKDFIGQEVQSQRLLIFFLSAWVVVYVPKRKCLPNYSTDNFTRLGGNPYILLLAHIYRGFSNLASVQLPTSK